MSCLSAGLLAVSFAIRIHQSALLCGGGSKLSARIPGGRGSQVQLARNLIQDSNLAKLHFAPTRIRCLFRCPSVFTERREIQVAVVYF